jgi:hypothetical protein
VLLQPVYSDLIGRDVLTEMKEMIKEYDLKKRARAKM